MLRFVVARCLSAVPLVLLIVLIAFTMLQLVPGDPAVVMLGIEATPERLAAVRAHLGLDRPLPEQFLVYLGNLATGDLGRSVFLDQGVGEAILERLPTSLLLAALSLTWAIGLGLPVGIVAATRRGSWVDQVVMLLSSLGMAVPSFWLALSLILVLGVWTGWFPTGGYVPLREDPLGAVWHLLLPSMSLGVIQMAQIARMTRSALLDVLRQDYIVTAHAKGLHPGVVLCTHALRNGLLSVLTVTGLIFAELLGGTVVTEQIFSIPGLGHLIISAVGFRDYPVIQGALIVVGLAYVGINLLTDLAYGAIDPRVRTP